MLSKSDLVLNCPAVLFVVGLAHTVKGVSKRSDRAGYKQMHLSACLPPFKSIGLSHGLSHLIRYSRCGIGGRAGCQLIPGLEGRSLAPPRALGNRAKLNLCKPFAICTRQGNESVKTY